MSATVSWREFICRACGHIYSERDGDPDSGISPGTLFEDIPDDWLCPLCGVTKADFVPHDREAAEKARQSACVSAPVLARSRVLGRGHDHDVVIVGGGTAAWRAAEAIRQISEDLSIAMVATCDAHRYDKPMLSVAFARGLMPSAMIKESGAAAAARLRVDLFPKTSATRIAASRSELRTTRGNFHYRHLVLAHGARSILPAGLTPGHCWRINHLDHYARFRAALEHGRKHVLMVGAGLIGAELANDLALGNHRVTLIDVANRPLARLVKDGAVTEALFTAWQSLPIQFIGGITVTASEKQADGYRVTLSNGAELHPDMIVVAAGLQTPDRLSRSAGLEWDNGIVVNPVSLRTCVPGIYAIGDCASIAGKVSRFIEPIARQALTIASQIHGEILLPYADLPLPVRVKTTSYPITVR